MPSTAEIARICHEANRTLQIIQCEATISEPWQTLDQETVLSAVDGVANIIDGTIKTPIESHDNWLRFKKDHGWSYGPIKDETTKQHPCFVSYEALPEDQKIKDALFFAIVGALSQ